MHLPKHVAIIMDGNGRWAEKRGLPRTAGHKVGAETLKKILTHAQKKGIEVITLYAFSSENWKRPAEEVQTLMNLFRTYLKNDVKELIKKGIRVSFIGERERFDADLVEQMNRLERQTADFQGFHVVLALSYGARNDIINAARQIAAKAAGGQIKPQEIDESFFSAHLSTADLPAPDFIIRTGGEERISNFLLWEAAYAELYFTSVFWPDFDEKALDDALEAYQRRERRYGGLNMKQKI